MNTENIVSNGTQIVSEFIVANSKQKLLKVN